MPGIVDAGNTVTLAHYLLLLEGAGMVAGLQKFSGNQIRQRASSPKLQVLNTALSSDKAGLLSIDLCRNPRHPTSSDRF